MTAEKWVVPDPILYELLSLPQVADNEEWKFSGIHLDPMFVCLQTKLLSYHWIGNVNGMANMLEKCVKIVIYI
jgi:transcriptional regulator with PAS, ATPase and Fis domain